MAVKRTATMRKAKPTGVPPRNPKPKPKDEPVKVEAIRDGYYDHARRRVGDVFLVDKKDLETTLPDGTKRPTSWFVEADKHADLVATGPNQAIERTNREVAAGKRAEASARRSADQGI